MKNWKKSKILSKLQIIARKTENASGGEKTTFIIKEVRTACSTFSFDLVVVLNSSNKNKIEKNDWTR